MGKQVMQFRYYGDKNTLNYPNGKSFGLTTLTSGNIFTNYLPIYRLSIEAPEGIKFYLNNGINPIIIGHSRHYDLDLTDLSMITNITFDGKSIKNLITGAEGDSNYMIINIIYEK